MHRRNAGDNATMPRLMEPGGEVAASPQALAHWVAGHRSELKRWLCRHAAVLLRGFGVDSPQRFREIAAAFRPELASYVGGDSPRSAVGDRVYTSTEFPREMEIGLHNELSYTHAWPEHVFFCCLLPARHGGETHIADGRQVLACMDPEVRDRFENKGVIYRQHLRDDAVTGPGKSWQESFETTDRARVERICDEQDMALRWTDRGLSTTLDNPAVLTHPITAERCWFNQADLWHARFDTVKAQEHDRADSAPGEQALGSHACFGDGTEIPISDLEAVRAAYRRTEVVFPWHAGDVLILDNVLAMHGRKPFEGDRRVLVAMA
ncbi:MAG: TauD/TfdA family dioxygenase [Gammaproteobacteria bacterium]|nr:TauD/TfdA family dioxygenase [Gammaproteobacteria bacterium]NIO66849.1 TauD/TfdA family dioxygenase [Gammaproteobacteria bacterium]NIP66058.1 TauD/TfdA family dioxygenase [Gammaproteobacteria bacterium]NIQ28129.1 TauD/TfdA family dioxygenase [Gammaproteobacteria bacterium]NIR21121.1 TauD/TfdA family dioxygenase [Gammaproteobacteria bacterium]